MSFNLMKQGVATTLLLGPFVDETSAVPETALTIPASEIQLMKEGVAGSAAKNDATALTHVASGVYSCPVNNTDLNTVGRLVVVCKTAGAIVVRENFFVVPAALYTALTTGAGLAGGLPTVDGSNRIAGIQGSVANTFDALLSTLIEDKPNITIREAIGLLVSTMVGQTTGMKTSTGRINSPDGTEARVVATLDGIGNRGVPTLTPPTL